MKWSDYISLVMTSPDFSIKEKLCPHFTYDGRKFFAQNRRHYVPRSEENIEFFKNIGNK